MTAGDRAPESRPGRGPLEGRVAEIMNRAVAAAMLYRSLREDG